MGMRLDMFSASFIGTYHAFILTSKGFFCIMHLPLANIQKAIIEMDINAAKKGVGSCAMSVWEVNPDKKLVSIQNVGDSSLIQGYNLLYGGDVRKQPKLVYKVKANTILEGLASAGWEDQSAWLKLVLQAKETLNKIKDNSFVVKYCIHTPWPTYETAQEMLNYARMMILKKEDTSAAHFTNVDPASLLTEVMQTQAKLTTFYGAFGPEKYSGTTWLEFLNNKNIVGYVLLQLKGGSLSSAQYLWLRHQKRVAKWLEKRARSLELTDKANWPENGLELAQKDSEDKEIHRLMDLVSALQDLVDLYRKYNCRLALCDFEKETTNTIVFRMLDKILAAELIPMALEKYIAPYMCHHRLEKDEILLRYIKDLLLCHCTQSSSIFDTSWEAKAIAVLGCMSDLEMLAKYILKQDTPSALGDALKIIKAYMLPTAEVYVWKIADLIDKEKESFEICLSLKGFCDPARTAQLLEDHIRAYEKAKRRRNRGGGETKPGDPGAKKELTPMRLYRLGFLLQKSEAEMGAELAFRALDDGKVEEALQICR
ncbi:Kinetochore-associated protein 1, partial [Ophiophagus hannah]